MSFDIKILGNASSAERVSSLIITKGAPYRKTVIHRVAVIDIEPGEMFLVHADAQVTTPYTYNVMLASDLVLMSDNGETVIEIGEGQGQNFNREEHHFNWVRIGSYTASIARTGRWWFCLRAWSASTAASSGHKLAVNSDHGRIVAWRFTPTPPVV